MKEKSPSLKNEIAVKVQETNRIPHSLDLKRNSPQDIIIKRLNMQSKERILKPSEEKDQVTYKGRHIGITPDFSVDPLPYQQNDRY